MKLFHQIYKSFVLLFNKIFAQLEFILTSKVNSMICFIYKIQLFEIDLLIRKYSKLNHLIYA